jgi:hypothetical protein
MGVFGGPLTGLRCRFTGYVVAMLQFCDRSARMDDLSPRNGMRAVIPSHLIDISSLLAIRPILQLAVFSNFFLYFIPGSGHVA